MQVIQIHPESPPKPAWGQPCNGCGVCCLAEPCPLGVLLSLKRTGPCKAVVWSDPQGRYLCGALARWGAPQPAASGFRRVWQPIQWSFARLTRRWIAAGQGCDASLEVTTQR